MRRHIPHPGRRPDLHGTCRAMRSSPEHAKRGRGKEIGEHFHAINCQCIGSPECLAPANAATIPAAHPAELSLSPVDRHQHMKKADKKRFVSTLCLYIR